MLGNPMGTLWEHNGNNKHLVPSPSSKRIKLGPFDAYLCFLSCLAKVNGKCETMGEHYNKSKLKNILNQSWDFGFMV